MTSPLHWSFDYQTNLSGTSFLDSVTSLLSQSKKNDPLNEQQHFAVIPNHQAGTTEHTLITECPLAYGQVHMTRTANAADLHYKVRYYNDASGDDLHLCYQCKNNAHRELMGTWSIKVENKGSGLYQTFCANGKLDNNNISLRIQDLQFNNGHINDGLPLICNWTLFDNFCEFTDNTSFHLLEDLEKVKSNCRIRALGQWSFQGKTYNGYTLQGRGVPETYYWLDQNRHVQLVSNVFSTFIRMEA